MNPFDVNIVAIAGELPIGGVIPASQLERYIDASAVLRRNRSRAAAVLIAARRHRERMRDQAREILREAHDEAQRRVARAEREAHDDTCASVVRWLVDEGELERVVARRLEARCRALVAEAVRALVGQSDGTATLLGRIDGQLRGLAPHGEVTIRVSPAERDAVAAGLPVERPFDLVTDPALEPGQALLDSPYVRLRIDLGRHLSEVLEAIRGTPAPAVEDAHGQSPGTSDQGLDVRASGEPVPDGSDGSDSQWEQAEAFTESPYEQ